MAALKGMNIEMVRTSAGQIKGEKLATIREALNSLNPLADGLEWEGEDKTKFVADVQQQVTQLTTSVEAALEQLAQTLEQNATAQETTSAQ